MSKCNVAERMARPHATLDHTISCKKYETKPAADPTKAIPPLAAIEPVNKKPISIIVKNPATCQVTALVMSLIVLSIEGFSAKGFGFPFGYPGYRGIDIV